MSASAAHACAPFEHICAGASSGDDPGAGAPAASETEGAAFVAVVVGSGLTEASAPFPAAIGWRNAAAPIITIATAPNVITSRLLHPLPVECISILLQKITNLVT